MLAQLIYIQFVYSYLFYRRMIISEIVKSLIWQTINLSQLRNIIKST